MQITRNCQVGFCGCTHANIVLFYLIEGSNTNTDLDTIGVEH